VVISDEEEKKDGIIKGASYTDQPKPVNVGKLTYFENRVIGLGSFHTVVYKGKS
jgi:hypothetical protein